MHQKTVGLHVVAVESVKPSAILIAYIKSTFILVYLTGFIVHIFIAEWEKGHGGVSQDMEVEIREEAASPRADPTMLLVNNSSAYPIAGNHSNSTFITKKY